LNKRFLPKKEKIYLLSREKRGEMHKFINKQLKKRYTRPSKSPQTATVFFVGNKNTKKRIVQDYKYLNEWTINFRRVV